MKVVFTTDLRSEASAVVAALRNAGIVVHLDGESTQALRGFYVPGVLRVFVQDSAQFELARRVVEDALVAHKRLTADRVSAVSRRSKSNRFIVFVGLALVGLVLLSIAMMVVGRLLR